MAFSLVLLVVTVFGIVLEWSGWERSVTSKRQFLMNFKEFFYILKKNVKEFGSNLKKNENFCESRPVRKKFDQILFQIHFWIIFIALKLTLILPHPHSSYSPFNDVPISLISLNHNSHSTLSIQHPLHLHKPIFIHKNFFC